MEKAVLESGVSKVVIVRPSFLMGNRSEKRFGEGIGAAIFKFLSIFMIGGLKKFKPIEATDVAKAMIFAAKNPVGKSIFESHELLQLV